MAVYRGSDLIAEKNPAQVSAAEKTAGTETGLRSYSPKDVADIVAAHGGGGIGGLEFFSRTTNLTLTTSYQNALSGNYTPQADDETVGLLVSVGALRGGTNSAGMRYRIRRGSTDLTGAIVGSPQPGYARQLFLDKPASTSQQTYALRAERYGSLSQLVTAGSSMTAFAMPDGVVSDIITSDESVSQNTDFLSVSITPSSASAKIKLNFLVLSSADAISLQVRRGTTGLVTATQRPFLITTTPTFPANFEDWVDEPNTTNAVTYHIRKTDSGSDTIQAMSYLMAQEV